VLKKSTNLSRVIDNGQFFTTASAGISTGSIHSILTENLLMKMSARRVPRTSSGVQKANQIEPSTSLLHLFNENPGNFVLRFMTAHESWLHRFDPVSKVQSTAWKHASSPLPRKFRVVVLAHKVMATIFWNVDGTVLTILSTKAPSQEPTMLIRLEKFRWQ